MNLKSKQLEYIAGKDLLKRIIEFLKESSAYVNILNIDYSLPTLQKKDYGYFGAFIDSQEHALNHIPITLSDLCRWQAMIVSEQLQFGHSITKMAVGKIRSTEVPINIKVEDYVPPDFSKIPNLIEKIVNDLNKRLHEVGDHGDEVSLVILLGDIVQKFEKVHPFVEANGRIGLLIANYIAGWFGFPIMVFRLSEKAEYYAAHQNAKSMRLFMAKKLQEVVFDEDGAILMRCENYGLTSSYAHPNKVEKLLIEWHSLEKAMNQWKEELKSSN